MRLTLSTSTTGMVFGQLEGWGPAARPTEDWRWESPWSNPYNGSRKALCVLRLPGCILGIAAWGVWGLNTWTAEGIFTFTLDESPSILCTLSQPVRVCPALLSTPGSMSKVPLKHVRRMWVSGLIEVIDVLCNTPLVVSDPAMNACATGWISTIHGTRWGFTVLGWLTSIEWDRSQFLPLKLGPRANFLKATKRKITAFRTKVI